ncbi:MAG: DUF4397 domain-containing protein, partial [Planctomycetota bacterium]
MLRKLFSVALLGAALVACGGSSGSNNDSTPTFQLRAVHASADAGNVDIYISGAAETVLRNVAYGDASTFLDVPQGTYNVAIRAAGADPTSIPVFEQNRIDLSANTQTLTVVAAGLVGGGVDDGFRLLTIFEDFDAPGAGQAIVRVIHAGADAPAVKVDVGDDAVNPNDSEIQNLARFQSTDDTGVALPAGVDLQLAIRTELDDTRVTAFTASLPEGAEILVIATGLLGKLARDADGFGLLAVGPAGALPLIRQNPIVYAAHAGPDAP